MMKPENSRKPRTTVKCERDEVKATFEKKLLTFFESEERNLSVPHVTEAMLAEVNRSIDGNSNRE